MAFEGILYGIRLLMSAQKDCHVPICNAVRFQHPDGRDDIVGFRLLVLGLMKDDFFTLGVSCPKRDELVSSPLSQSLAWVSGL